MQTLDGVMATEASYRQGMVVVEYEPAKVTPDQIAGAINTQTYFQAAGVVEDGEGAADVAEEGASVEETATAVIQVEGMTDDLSASEVMSSMGAGEAITDVSIDLPASTLTVEFDPTKTKAGFFELAINGYTSYRATVLSTTEAEAEAGAAARTFDYAKYAVWGIVALVALGLAWSALNWGRRRWATSTPPLSKAAQRRQRRRDRGRSSR